MAYLWLISVINRPGSKAFGLVRRKVVFDGVLILLLLPPPHTEVIIMAARVMHFPSALVFMMQQLYNPIVGPSVFV